MDVEHNTSPPTPPRSQDAYDGVECPNGLYILAFRNQQGFKRSSYVIACFLIMHVLLTLLREVSVDKAATPPTVDLVAQSATWMLTTLASLKAWEH